MWASLRVSTLSALSGYARELSVNSYLLPGVLRRSLVLMLFAFPRQHHSVAHGQADVLDARIVLHQLVESNDSSSVVVFGVENLAAPQNVIADNQSAGPYQWKGGFVIVAVVRLVGVGGEIGVGEIGGRRNWGRVFTLYIRD